MIVLTEKETSRKILINPAHIVSAVPTRTGLSVATSDRDTFVVVEDATSLVEKMREHK